MKQLLPSHSFIVACTAGTPTVLSCVRIALCKLVTVLAVLHGYTISMYFVVASVLSFVITRLAISSSLCCSRILMTIFAMGNHLSKRCKSHSFCFVVASPLIDDQCNWFEVVWINAASNTTQMIDCEPFWDRAYMKLIGESVSYSQVMFSNREVTVSLGADMAHPNPTTGFGNLFNKIVKPVSYRFNILYNCIRHCDSLIVAFVKGHAVLVTHLWPDLNVSQLRSI